MFTVDRTTAFETFSISEIFGLSPCTACRYRSAPEDAEIAAAGLTETFGQVGLTVDEHLGGHDVTERQERLRQVRVGELRRQVVDEEVAAVGTLRLPTGRGGVIGRRQRRGTVGRVPCHTGACVTSPSAELCVTSAAV